MVRDERVGERRASVLVTRIRGEGWVKKAEEEQLVLRILSEASMDGFGMKIGTIDSHLPLLTVIREWILW